ncbi:hypothetical protein BS78_01G287400 [Paspalum vaginatum]|nr:hypothetical protein BS78_01G287400 [Paspalum vaginatum]
MVIHGNIAGWTVTKVLVDNGSSADVILASALDDMGISRQSLKPSDYPLCGFGGKKTNCIGKIDLPASFADDAGARTETVTFDVVDIYYPYNVILGRGTINSFDAAIHSHYLCMKIPAPFRVITVYGSQKEARDIEKAYTLGQRNVHVLDEAPTP